MADPANSIIESLAGGERLVATLMGQDPQTCTEQALHEGISRPQRRTKAGRGNVFGCDELIRQVKGHTEGENVTEDIV